MGLELHDLLLTKEVLYRLSYISAQSALPMTAGNARVNGALFEKC